MTPAELSRLHHRSFVTTRPWSKNEFADFLSSKLIFLVTDAHGFALGRTVADETELLTIAVDPNFQRRGVGSDLLSKFERESVGRGARYIFLEVAATNLPAIRLYQKAGFNESARRKSYYRIANGANVDAIMMQKTSG